MEKDVARPECCCLDEMKYGDMCKYLDKESIKILDGEVYAACNASESTRRYCGTTVTKQWPNRQQPQHTGETLGSLLDELRKVIREAEDAVGIAEMCPEHDKCDSAGNDCRVPYIAGKPGAKWDMCYHHPDNVQARRDVFTAECEALKAKSKHKTWVLKPDRPVSEEIDQEGIRHILDTVECRGSVSMVLKDGVAHDAGQCGSGYASNVRARQFGGSFRNVHNDMSQYLAKMLYTYTTEQIDRVWYEVSFDIARYFGDDAK
jgi:hypothetical protein